MLKDIRSCLMEKMYTKLYNMAKVEDAIYPMIRKQIENSKLDTKL